MRKRELISGNVVIANSISRAAQKLNLSEKRILMAGIVKLNGVNGEVKLSAQEYAETYGIDVHTAYDQLKAAVNSLMKRSLSWQIRDGNKIGTRHTIWVQWYDYFKDQGVVRFKFSESVFPFLFELKCQFTQYKLKQAASLRSIYSWRLLELIEQMRQTVEGKKEQGGWLSMSIEDFWHAMEASETYRKNFSLLRKWVIEPAVKELTAKDGWRIEWEAQKEGRRVASLLFKFEKAGQRETRG
ncbi:replication initiation protein, partial [Neisseria blantyrii]